MNIQELKELAEKATPGPWIYRKMTETEDPEISAANGTRVAELACADMTKQNSAYIAAANPAVVLSLIGRLENAGRMLAAAQECCNQQLDEKKELWAQRDEILEVLKLAKAEIEAAGLAESVYFGADPLVEQKIAAAIVRCEG